jgi:hypothetical protein
MTQETVEYHGQREFNKDKPKRLKNGWRVVSVSEVRQPVGVKRIATIGIGAIVIKPKPYIFVVYERTDAVQRPTQAAPTPATSSIDARVQAEAAKNKLVDLQAQLRAVEDQPHYIWTMVEAHIEEVSQLGRSRDVDAERDFMANLDKFLDASWLVDNKRRQVLAALATAQTAYSIAQDAGAQITPSGIDIVGESGRLRTLIADEAKKTERVRGLALAQKRVTDALRDKVAEPDLQAIVTERNVSANGLRPQSRADDSEPVAPSSAGVTEDVSQSSQRAEASSDIDMLRKLAELHEAGVLTDDEFAAKKAELLSRL